ncbi:MAG: hypothetical protein IPL61_13355 [Myxococcales bacterium]|nr:hypothetical protein [Myxococcales bacterium]
MSNVMQIHAAAGGAAGALGVGGSGAHVVVACEHASRRAAIVDALARDGHRLSMPRAPLEFYAQVGIAGPDLHHPRPPDLVIIDTTGTRWTTPELLELACGAPWHLPTVALVGADDPHAAPRACALGARAALTLPLDPHLLRAEVVASVLPAARGAA